MCTGKEKAGRALLGGGFLPAALRGALPKALLASPRKTSAHSATPSPETSLSRDSHAKNSPPSPQSSDFRDKPGFFCHLSRKTRPFRDRHLFITRVSPNSRLLRDKRWLSSSVLAVSTLNFNTSAGDVPFFGPFPAKKAIFACNLRFLGTSPTVWSWQVMVVVQKIADHGQKTPVFAGSGPLTGPPPPLKQLYRSFPRR